MFVFDSACLQISVFEFQYFERGRHVPTECDGLFQDPQFRPWKGDMLEVQRRLLLQRWCTSEIFYGLRFHDHCYAENLKAGFFVLLELTPERWLIARRVRRVVRSMWSVVVQEGQR